MQKSKRHIKNQKYCGDTHKNKQKHFSISIVILRFNF